ncbi:hypothetical protein CIG75_11460 [Tumebacillus algifaecis]|uniref:Uncharacterized protein n=1 Tax=Tumebacillus algifaecis TaxID=1214604 RepID=A0A223D1W0_9BACL|nr:hypothetical protein [Tumebacillus algifaecis]ASS75541.1 hypothetical protein CIG75_11460 [Tumebacillus algifaecis]
MKQFVNVKTMDGELKRTEIRRGVGYRLTTKEMILLREEVSYHIYLEDILGVISREEEAPGIYQEQVGDTTVAHHFGSSSYKIVATKLRMYNRSGVVERGASTLFAQLSPGFTKQLLELLQA